MIEIPSGERLVLDALDDGIIVVRNGRISYGNPAASRLLGSPLPDELARLTPTSLVGLIEGVLVGGDTEAVFARGRPARWIEAIARPLAGGDGAAVLVLRDVTERRRVEAMRRDFVADASHELKTPVASIQASAETLVRALAKDPAAAGRFAAQVHASAVRLSQMVTELLDLSRVESERPELAEVSLDRLVTKEVDRIAGRAVVSGIDLVIDTEPVIVQANRKDLRLAVRNLLDNALSYTPEGGTVSVSTGLSGADAVIAVSDTGIGIPSRDVDRIFERFYRVDDARDRDSGGTGLGLAIVRNVADQHGGSVEVESELGRGSTFRIRLPPGPV